MRWSLDYDNQVLLRLRGTKRREVLAFELALRRLALAPAIACHAAVVRVQATATAEQRWIPTEVVAALLAARPDTGLLDRIRAAGCVATLARDELDAARFVDTDLAASIAGVKA